MKIQCSQCQKPFESLIVDRNMALKELTDGLMKHVQKLHPDIFNLVAKANGMLAAAIMWLVSMSELAIIPEDETFILAEMEKNQDNIMKGLGFDPEEEDNEEIEDEDTEDLEPDLEKVSEENIEPLPSSPI